VTTIRFSTLGKAQPRVRNCCGGQWSLALAEFDLDIKYTKGSENVVAAYLSRM